MGKLLVLTSRFPFPLEKGDKLRIYNQLKGLSRNNTIHLVAVNHLPVTNEQQKALEPYCEKITVLLIPHYQRAINLLRALFNGQPLQTGLFYTKRNHAKIRMLIAGTKPDAIYCHLIRMAHYVSDESGIRKTIDYMDVFSKGMERRVNATSNILKKLVFNFEYRRLLKYEAAVFDQFDERVIISGQDRDEIPHADKSKIKVIPNGVDFSVFHPLGTQKKYDLLFTGNMAYPPNIESAYYAATKIMPLLKKKYPGITLLIAGTGAPAKIRALHSENIIIIEEWTNIRDAFAQSKIMLAPMLISIGLQNKILQAMAMKIPVIASTLANNAINAPADEAVLIADTPDEYVAQIVKMLEDPGIADTIATAAYDFVRNNFSWDTHNATLDQLINGTEHER